MPINKILLEKLDNVKVNTHRSEDAEFIKDIDDVLEKTEQFGSSHLTPRVLDFTSWDDWVKDIPIPQKIEPYSIQTISTPVTVTYTANSSTWDNPSYNPSHWTASKFYDYWTSPPQSFIPQAPTIAEAIFDEQKEEETVEKTKRVRYPAYKKNDRVQTPEGPGNIWSVDRDGIVCVELDKDPTILHEFEKKELKKIKG